MLFHPCFASGETKAQDGNSDRSVHRPALNGQFANRCHCLEALVCLSSLLVSQEGQECFSWLFLSASVFPASAAACGMLESNGLEETPFLAVFSICMGQRGQKTSPCVQHAAWGGLVTSPGVVAGQGFNPFGTRA